MQKLMRKHGKLLMTIMGVGLMVAFGLPQLSNMGSQVNLPIGTLAGKKLYGTNVAYETGMMRILRNFGLPIQMTARNEDEDDQALQFYLLVQEAQSYGISPTPAEIDSLVKNQETREKMDDAQLNAFLASMNVSAAGFHEAIKEWLMIAHLQNLARNSLAISLPEVEYNADQYESQATVTAAIADALKDWDKAPAPTDEKQIEHQYELYKSVEPAAIWTPENPVTPPEIGGHTYPFGYKFPDRVQVEYLRFDRGALLAEDQFKPTEADLEAAYQNYQSHPQKFAQPQTQPATQAGTQAATAAASQPAIKPWNQVKDELVREEIGKRVSKVLTQMVERSKSEADAPWKAAEGATLSREKWSDYKAIAQDIAKDHAFGGYRPTYFAVTSFLSAAQLSKLSGIGEAYLQNQDRQIPFSQMATNVKELVGEKGPLGTLFLTIGVEPQQALRDPDGNLYIYRVVAAEGAHEAANINVEDVHQRVVDDLKKIASYEKAQALAKAVAELARTGDLAAIAKTKGLEVRTERGMAPAGKQIIDMQIMRSLQDIQSGQATLSRFAGTKLEKTFQDEIQGDQDQIREWRNQMSFVPGVVDAVFAMAREPAATQAASNGKLAKATTTLAKDDSLKVFVLALDEYHPEGGGAFATERTGLVQLGVQQDQSAFLVQWLSLPAISQRMHYVPAERKTPEKPAN